MTTERIEEILEATTTGWWVYHVPSDTLDVNDAWLKMLGYSAGVRLDSEGGLSIVHPDDRILVLGMMSDPAHQDECMELDVRMRDSNGQFHWFSIRMKITEHAPNGQPVSVVGISVSIRGEKKVEELERDVQKKAQLIQGLMRIAFSSITIYDFLHQRVISSQWRILKSLGYEESEFEAVSDHFFAQILHPDDGWIIENHIKKIRQSKKEEVVECIFRIRSKSGSYHWVAMRDSILRWDKKGEICQLIGALIDVTRYKSIKQQLDANLSMLASLSYRNSHELRAPVATILGLVNVIRYELQTEGNIQELIDFLEDTITRMDNVIREFGKALG
jgi:PAS domain S-box-containing protein